MKSIAVMSRYLLAGAAVAGLALTSSVALAAHIPGLSFTEEPFTVNYTDTTSSINYNFNAKYIDFSYIGEVDQPKPGGLPTSFDETGGGFFGTFRNSLGGPPIPLTGLGTDYQLYFLFSGDGTAVPSFGGIDGVFNSFNITFYVDPMMNTTLTTVTPGGADESIAVAGGGLDDAAVLTGTLIVGQGGFHVFPGLAAGDFDVLFDATSMGNFFSCTAGAFSPTCKATGDMNGVNTTLTGISPPPAGFTDGVIIGSGNASFQSVPEPASLALLGVGLAGMGFAGRRRLKK